MPDETYSFPDGENTDDPQEQPPSEGGSGIDGEGIIDGAAATVQGAGWLADGVAGAADVVGGAAEGVGSVLEGAGGCLEGCAGCSLAVVVALCLTASTAFAIFR